MSILVSHETPLAYLEDSRRYNDYDYCLVHLCDKYEQYLNFYRDSVRQGREVLLDNSIFELGKAFDWDKFAKRVIQINPTYYIVPDVLEDAAETMVNFERFTEKFHDLPGKKIGVVQGKTKKQLVDCYKFMLDKADYIAISFDYSYYQITGYGDNKLQRYMAGRQDFVAWLVQTGVWNPNVPHHLLGCSLAREFEHYKGLRGLRSIDTSNPVVAALDGKRYMMGWGLDDKSPVKLADQMEVEYDLDTLRLIQYNTREFKNLIGR